MKKIIAFMIILMAIQSCDDLSELNENPNATTKANPEQVLTAAVANLGYVEDGLLNNWYAMFWAQYMTWGPGVAVANVERLDADPSEVYFRDIWDYLYTRVLVNLQFVENADNPGLSGIAKLLTAYSYQVLVDNFGDVPYGEALHGSLADGGVFTPKFDNAKDIYASLISLVDDGLAKLDNVGPEDIIYNGDAAKWVKFGHSLKLKLLMRQSNLNDPAITAQIQALIAQGDFIETADDMAAIPYDGVNGTENPMFAANEAYLTYFYIASNTSLDYLRQTNDPRIDAIYAYTVNDPTVIKGIYQASVNDEPFTNTVDDYSQSTPIVYGADNDVILMSPWEVWSLRAEAGARYGAGDDADALHHSIHASFDYLGASGAEEFFNSLNYTLGLELKEKLKIIGTQKWVACNGVQEDEGWIEMRRFDTPDNRMFTDPDNGILQTPTMAVLPAGVYPNILLYPQNEISYNPNAGPQHDLTDKVFWDN